MLSNTDAAEMLLDSGPARVGELREVLQDIRKADLRASEVVERMRRLLRKHEVELTPCDVDDVAAEVLTLVRSDAERRRVGLIARLEGPHPVQGDRVHLQQVLLNLIMNAMDAVAACPVERRQDLGAEQPGRSGGGLPLRTAPDMSADTLVVHVVDDDDVFRTAILRLLRAAGYEARGYASAGDFLLTLPGPDAHGCLLLDVSMPGPSGLDLQEAMNRSPLALPVIFLTGRADVPSSVRAMKAGASDFLTKPVERKTLLAAVQRAIERNAQVLSGRRELAALRVAERARAAGVRRGGVRKTQQADRGRPGRGGAHRQGAPRQGDGEDGRLLPGRSGAFSRPLARRAGVAPLHPLHQRAIVSGTKVRLSIPPFGPIIPLQCQDRAAPW
jgi:FixJ family two-component response regulator